MPATKTERLEARISADTLSQIRELSRLWGAVKPLTQADVATEAIRRAWEAEKRKERRR